MDTIHSIDLIATNPDVRGGRPCLVGTGIEVSTIVIALLFQAHSAGEIATDNGIQFANRLTDPLCLPLTV